jgi:hypothetical protein
MGAGRVENPASVVTVKVVETDPAETVTDTGIVTISLLVESPTTAPPKGAGLDSATVQTLELPPVTVKGEHCIGRSAIDGVVTDNGVVCDTPP